MRLVTVDGRTGRRLGALVRDDIVEFPAESGWPATMRELAGAGDPALAPIRSWLAGGGHSGRPLADVRLAAPIPDPGKVVAIGLNYARHAAETGQKVPSSPLVFAKFTTSIVGPDAVVSWDRGLTDKVDYEAELGVVIGKRARNVSEKDALSHVFGYTCLNDVSARDLQFGDGQWVRGKSLDTFCPIGPWIVTADEIADPNALTIECVVNGEPLQSSNTADMIFGVRTLISSLSHSFTLEPGDVIATGTPEGVGSSRKPPRMLADGDVMVIRIEGVGELRNTCRATGQPA
jgi:2-keto-4-pentenoate hydratase/2-oxohepta-3-ene-1,7-dioic acid hydratase in catechol pathway